MMIWKLHVNIKQYEWISHKKNSYIKSSNILVWKKLFIAQWVNYHVVIGVMPSCDDPLCILMRLINFIGCHDVTSTVNGDIINLWCCVSLFIFQQNATEKVPCAINSLKVATHITSDSINGFSKIMKAKTNIEKMLSLICCIHVYI